MGEAYREPFRITLPRRPAVRSPMTETVAQWAHAAEGRKFKVICAARIEGDPLQDDRVTLTFRPNGRRKRREGQYVLAAEVAAPGKAPCVPSTGPLIGYNFGLVTVTKDFPTEDVAWEIGFSPTEDVPVAPSGPALVAADVVPDPDAPLAAAVPAPVVDSAADSSAYCAPAPAPAPTPAPADARSGAAERRKARSKAGWFVQVKVRLGAASGPAAGGKRAVASFYAAKATWVPSADLVGRLPDLALVIPEFAAERRAGERIRYFGAFDVDGDWDDTDRRIELEAWLRLASGSGKTVEDACIRWPELARARAQAERLAEAARGAGATNVLCYFTGLKGFRVLFRHPGAFRRVRASEMLAGPAARSLLPSLLGFEDLEEFDCIDRSIYDISKGLKPDVYPHPVTGIWPTRDALGPQDALLQVALVDHWAWLASSAPREAPDLRGAPRPASKKRRRAGGDGEGADREVEEGEEEEDGADGGEGSASAGGGPNRARKRGKPERSTETPLGSLAMIRGRYAEAGARRTHQEWLPTRHLNLRATRDEILRSAAECVRNGHPFYTHEVVPHGGAPVRLFLDVDRLKGGAPCAPVVETSIVRRAQAYLREHYPVERCEALVLAAAGAASGHVVFPRIYHEPRAIRHLVRYIVRQLEPKDRPRIDEAVCSEGRSLRMPGASKRIESRDGYMVPSGQALEPVARYAGDGTPLPTPSLLAALPDGSILPPGDAEPVPVPPIIARAAALPRGPGGSAAAWAQPLTQEQIDAGWTPERARRAAARLVRIFAESRGAPGNLASIATQFTLKPMTEAGAFGWVAVPRDVLWCPLGSRYHSEKEKWSIGVNFRADRATASCRSATCGEKAKPRAWRVSELLDDPIKDAGTPETERKRPGSAAARSG